MPSQHLSLNAEHVPSITLLNLLLMVGKGTMASKMGFSVCGLIVVKLVSEPCYRKCDVQMRPIL